MAFSTDPYKADPVSLNALVGSESGEKEIISDLLASEAG
jgi:hypothetical protein